MIDETWYARPASVPQRTSAGGVIARVEAGEVLVGLVREGDFPDYILPKGRLEAGEDVEAAAVREIGEEAGLTELHLLFPLGVRERLSFDRRWWIITHYFLFATSQTAGTPSDIEHAYWLEWFPLQDLPHFFWPEQAELVASAKDAIEKAVLGSAPARPDGGQSVGSHLGGHMAESPPMELSFAPLDLEHWADLEALFGANGACGGCWCMWWRLPRPEFEATKGEGTRQAMRQLVESGHAPGILAYSDGRPIGWCSVGPRDDFPTLERTKAFKRVDEQPVWSIVCFFVARKHRRRGVTKALVAAAVQYARERGAEIVEGYPVSPKRPTTPDMAAYTGLPTTFTDLGFKEVARRSETRPIMRLDLRAPQE